MLLFDNPFFKFKYVNGDDITKEIEKIGKMSLQEQSDSLIVTFEPDDNKINTMRRLTLRDLI